VVGSRRADAYGREASELFGRALASAGLTVVSGFARGVDAAAHRGALDGAAEREDRAGLDGRRCATVAVLGTGLGVDYPRGHRRLGDAIAARGAVISEFPCGLAPKAWQFPVRNRLIAALAGATLVVRAARRSGSLVTARFALDLGRDVLAVPGRIFEERSRGTNALIADGAYPALSPRQVLSILGVDPDSPRSVSATAPDGAPPPDAQTGSPPERRERSATGGGDPATATDRPAGGRPRGLQGRLLAAMAPAEPASPEALAERVEASVDRVLGALLELELSGRVRREPGPAYVRRPEMP
jgi:DNA processing protein